MILISSRSENSLYILFHVTKVTKIFKIKYNENYKIYYLVNSNHKCYISHAGTKIHEVYISFINEIPLKT